jgi:hypothetical protein
VNQGCCGERGSYYCCNGLECCAGGCHKSDSPECQSWDDDCNKDKCNFDCDGKKPTFNICEGGGDNCCDCDIKRRAIDICRGKLTHGNCQKCKECKVDANCDLGCHCCEGKPLDDPCWGSCYEKGVGYDPQANDYPNAPYNDGTYNCRNTQWDVIMGGMHHVWNCTWEDGRTWWECEDVPDYLNVQGKVYCQDENGPVYPIQGAQVLFYKDGAPEGSKSETLVTGEEGFFNSASGVTETTYGGFAVRLQSIPQDGVIEETGIAYSDMTGPVLNADVCNSGACDHCGDQYEMCGGLKKGANAGFQWVYGNCQQEAPNPDWDIEKKGTPVCYEEGTTAVYVDIDYVIEVTNVKAGGDLEYVRDEYDEQINSEWIISTNPQASEITEEYIQWTIPQGERTFEEGESREFTYKVRIPLYNNRHILGEHLQNHVVAHLSEGEDIHAYEEILVGCDLPDTGLFDNTAGRLALGAILLVFAIISYNMGIMDGVLSMFFKGSDLFGKKIRFRLSEENRLRKWEEKSLKKIVKKRTRQDFEDN